jgi:ribosomal protein L1
LLNFYFIINFNHKINSFSTKIIKFPGKIPNSRILGPKGLMPNAKLGTLVAPVALEQAIAEAKKGQITFRVDQGGNLHAPLGKVSMSD